jgi:hypothetical protein
MAIFSTSQNKNPLTDPSKNLYNWLRWRDHKVGQSSWWSAGGIAAPHISEVVGWRSFFHGDFSGKPTAHPERSSPTYYTSIDAVLAKDVPFGGLTDTYHSTGELAPQKTHFGDVNGDFQPKR